MIHVVLDTNIFSSDRRRNSGAFRAFARLCKGGKVKLHVPFVVRNEFLSQQKQEVRKLLKDFRRIAHELSTITLHDEISGFPGRYGEEGRTPERGWVIWSKKGMGEMAERDRRG